MGLLSHVLVPVASEDDAKATCEALEPYLADVSRITAVHVIEKGGGVVDKAPLEKREEDAAMVLTAIGDRLDERVQVDTQVAYGTDVVSTLFDAADATDADSIAFRARGGSRLTRLLAGDTASKLVTNPSLPVVSLPDPER